MSSFKFTELLIATKNKGKITEFKELFKDLPIKLISISDLEQISEPEESGSSFEENAKIKASEYAQISGLYAFSDDSGLEVDALNGLPGVHSARYAGKDADHAVKIAKLLAELDATGDEMRIASFTSVIALAAPDGKVIYTAKGICSGRIANAPAGSNGFGYDPVFIPDGYDLSFGQLPDSVKGNISHRSRASSQFIGFLSDYLKN